MLQNKEAWLQQSKLAKMLCMGHKEFGANRWRFLSKANTLYFRLCKNCEFMMCILIVNHQLNRMHPWCSWELIQFPPEMDENWVRYGLAKLGQISKLPNWQRMLFCAYTTQLLHSTGEVCWNNNDSYFIWFEFVCRNSGQIASRRSWKRSCLGLEYTSKCSRLALLWEPN